MLKCYLVVVTICNTGAFTAGETPAPKPTPAPMPLSQFDYITYEISKHFTKEDVVKVFQTFGGYDEKFILEKSKAYPEKTILTLQTPAVTGGAYFLTAKVPGSNEIWEQPFMLNVTESVNLFSKEAKETYLVDGNKLTHMLVQGDKTIKTVWEFSDDQVIETLESGDAKATRVWKAQKKVNSKQ